MLLSSPIQMALTSARATTLAQRLERSPISTSPITWALGSTYADAAILGRTPRWARII